MSAARKVASTGPHRDQLLVVLRAQNKAEAANARVESAIRDAHASGASLRLIADAAGLSHETVRKIVAD